MANKYYIWKDPNFNGTNPDWIEISGTQFFALGKDKSQKRYFKRIDDGVEDGADVLIMETTYEEYKDWHKKQESKRRKKKSQEQYKPQFISLDELTPDSEFGFSYLERTSELKYKITELRGKRVKLLNADEDERLIEDLKVLKEILDEYPKVILHFDNSLFSAIVDKVVVGSEKTVMFKLKGGLHLEVEMTEVI